MLGRTAMSSFSDAHALAEIPLIAANLHRLMLPRQSQIWAVLHPSTATTSGLQPGGDLSGPDAPVRPTRRAVRASSGAWWNARWRFTWLRAGSSRTARAAASVGWGSLEAPAGRVRSSGASRRTVARYSLVAHAFADAPAFLEVPLPPGGAWRVRAEFAADMERSDRTPTDSTPALRGRLHRACSGLAHAQKKRDNRVIKIEGDARALGTPLTHFWSVCVGAGRG